MLDMTDAPKQAQVGDYAKFLVDTKFYIENQTQPVHQGLMSFYGQPRLGEHIVFAKDIGGHRTFVVTQAAYQGSSVNQMMSYCITAVSKAS